MDEDEAVGQDAASSLSSTGAKSKYTQHATGGIQTESANAAAASDKRTAEQIAADDKSAEDRGKETLNLKMPFFELSFSLILV